MEAQSEYEASQALCRMLRRGRLLRRHAAACHRLLNSSRNRIRRPRPRLRSASPSSPRKASLRVGVNANNAPLAGQPSSSTKIVGIDVDMAAALADQLGLKLEVVDVSTDAAGALTSGKVDVVMGVEQVRFALASGLPTRTCPPPWRCSPSPPTPRCRRTSASTKIAAQVSSNSAWAVTNEFDNSTITTTERPQERLLRA